MGRLSRDSVMTHTEYMREWRARPENKERIREGKKRSYERNREATLARQRVAYAANPEAHRARQKARREADPDGVRAAAREQARRRRQRSPERVRSAQFRWRLANRYGLTTEAYRDLLIGQAGRCLICGRADRDLVIDHDHATARVRGLLCAPCNSILGLANDRPSVLLAGARFLG